VVAHILDSFETRLACQTAEPEDALAECLKTLPDESRELLTLRYGESLSMAKIAKQVGRTAAATQRAISRLRVQLGECVERRLGNLPAQ
jgi:RNA polymerase sigma-70 factor (ECF subfamily)